MDSYSFEELQEILEIEKRKKDLKFEYFNLQEELNKKLDEREPISIKADLAQKKCEELKQIDVVTRSFDEQSELVNNLITYNELEQKRKNIETEISEIHEKMENLNKELEKLSVNQNDLEEEYKNSKDVEKVYVDSVIIKDGNKPRDFQVINLNQSKIIQTKSKSLKTLVNDFKDRVHRKFPIAKDLCEKISNSKFVNSIKTYKDAIKEERIKLEEKFKNNRSLAERLTLEKKKEDNEETVLIPENDLVGEKEKTEIKEEPIVASEKVETNEETKTEENKIEEKNEPVQSNNEEIKEEEKPLDVVVDKNIFNNKKDNIVSIDSIVKTEEPKEDVKEEPIVIDEKVETKEVVEPEVKSEETKVVETTEPVQSDSEVKEEVKAEEPKKENKIESLGVKIKASINTISKSTKDKLNNRVIPNFITPNTTNINYIIEVADNTVKNVIANTKELQKEVSKIDNQLNSSNDSMIGKDNLEYKKKALNAEIENNKQILNTAMKKTSNDLIENVISGEQFKEASKFLDSKEQEIQNLFNITDQGVSHKAPMR